MSGITLYLVGFLGYLAGAGRRTDKSGSLSGKAIMALAWPFHVAIMLFVILERVIPAKK